MSHCIAGTTAGMFWGGLFGGGISAAWGAASGAIGSAILDKCGYPGYFVREATEMGAAGNAVIGGAIGMTVGCLAGACLGSINNKGDNDRGYGPFLFAAAFHVGTHVLGGLAGYGIMNNGDNHTNMELGQTAASVAVGGALTSLIAVPLHTCIVIPLIFVALACAVGCVNGESEEKEDATALEQGLRN